MNARFYQQSRQPKGFLLARGLSADQLNEEIDRMGYVEVHEGRNYPHIANTIRRSDQIRNPKSQRHPKGQPLVTALYAHVTPTKYYVIVRFAHLMAGRFSPLQLNERRRKALHDAGLLQYEFMPDHMRRHMGVTPKQALQHFIHQ